MIDSVKDYLVPKRFGVVAYICLIVHFLCGMTLTSVTSALRASEIGKFTCTIDKKTTAAYKTYIEKTCYSRYEQAYNSPLPLYGFVLLSIGITVLVSVIYSLAVSRRVDAIDRTSNGSDEPTTDGDQTSDDGFYVFSFYFFHLVARSLFGILFTVLQHTVLYPSGFDSSFSCRLPTIDITSKMEQNANIGLVNTTSMTCENTTASEKQVWAVIVSVLNTVFALIIFGEVIYLWRRFPILKCRPRVGWSSDTEFITVYLLRKRYTRGERELPSINDNIANCIQFYKQQLLNSLRTCDIFYPTSEVNLDHLYIDVIIHTGRALHLFSKEMNRHEIFNVYMKVPEDSIRLREIKDLFYPNKDTKDKFPRTILAVGRPGIGKTVLTEKLIRDWARGIDDFYCGKIVFLFKIRWFNKIDELKKVSLKTFLRYGTKLSEEKFQSIFEEVLKEPKKAIFIFDGLDEFDGDLMNYLQESQGLLNDCNISTSAMNFFIKLAFGDLLQGSAILVTSRPTADDFYSRLNFDRSVEIIGFTSDKIEEYVSTFCENINRSDLKPKIWNHINSSTDVLNLCYIPVNSFIVCTTLSGCLSDPRNDTGGGELPTTLTDLYKTAIDHFVTHRNRKLGDKSSKQTVESLAKLAFHGMENGQLVFDKHLLDEQMRNSGLVNSLSNPIFPVQTQFCFIHLSMQEYLAARHVTETLAPNEIEKFISTHIKSGRWHLVLQFIAGLLGEKIKMFDSDYHDCVFAFAKSLTVGHGDFEIDLNDSGHVLVLKCLKEVDDEEIAKKACELPCLNHVTRIRPTSRYQYN